MKEEWIDGWNGCAASERGNLPEWTHFATDRCSFLVFALISYSW